MGSFVSVFMIPIAYKVITKLLLLLIVLLIILACERCGQWAGWSQCSNPCGIGQASRDRNCPPECPQRRQTRNCNGNFGCPPPDRKFIYHS